MEDQTDSQLQLAADTQISQAFSANYRTTVNLTPQEIEQCEIAVKQAAAKGFTTELSAQLMSRIQDRLGALERSSTDRFAWRVPDQVIADTVFEFITQCNLWGPAAEDKVIIHRMMPEAGTDKWRVCGGLALSCARGRFRYCLQQGCGVLDRAQKAVWMQVFKNGIVQYREADCRSWAEHPCGTKQ
mmetsp:Transcript_37627/g.60971  ORF Transcript_37627/g.60971 Transcript_37627/m.60971 type:complete len:186 (+) Transcript_37627:75-632(+)